MSGGEANDRKPVMAIARKSALEHPGLPISEATAADYFALLKPRVMSLVVFTAFVGLVAAPVAVNPLLAVVAILAIAIGAGAAGALNMWYDADIDVLMARTASRPIPQGRIEPRQALVFGLVLTIAGAFWWLGRRAERETAAQPS